MFVGELDDDLWLECLPLDLDIYFEEISAPKAAGEKVSGYDQINGTRPVSDRDVYEHAAFMITAIVA